jgi:hypothetical protein
MTQAELMAGVLEGKLPCMVVEYRSSIGDTVKFRGKTGEMKTAGIVKHTVEFSGGSFAVSGFVEDGTDPVAVAKSVPHKKGQKVVLELSEFVQEKGVISARGRLLPLELPPIKP